jgi:glycosyltransferase involved in cell wall biosynthesis
MKFSVVVPLYNKAAYVRQALGSLLAQTFTDFEVVVIDDGSTDGSGGAVESLGDPRIRLFPQSNAGVSSARNRGIREARGEWVAFLDADDWLHPDYLERLTQVIDAHPDVSFVACAVDRRPDTADWAPVAWPLPRDVPARVIRDLPRWEGDLAMCMDTVAFRRELLLALMPCFAPEFRYFEDIDLYFRAAERTPLAYLPVPLACYRTAVAGSAMSRIGAADLRRFADHLQARVRADAVPPALVPSTLRYSAVVRILVARADSTDGRRASAVAQLLCGWRAMNGSNWWYTFAMMAGAPANLRGHLRRLFRQKG